MLKKIIHAQLNKAEKQLGGSVDYLRYTLDHSFGAFIKFAKLPGIVQYRKALPVDLYHVASMVASRGEDCGECVQIAIVQAKRESITAETIRAVLEDRPADFTERQRLVYEFAQAVVQHDDARTDLRERIRQELGDEALVELALLLSVAKTFPTMKRALGFDARCVIADLNI